MSVSRRTFWFGAAFASMAGSAAAAGSSHSASQQAQQAPATRQERLTSAESYIPMATLSVSVLQRQSTQGTLVVDMGVDVPDETLRHRALANLPRLQDALRTALAVYANTYYRDRTAPEPAVITRLMQQAIDRTLGGAGARILLANIIYQRRHG